LTLLGVAGALLLAGALPLTAEGTEEFTFSLDPLAFGILETDVDTGSAKFEEYRDLGSGFTIPKLRLFGTGDGGDRYLVLRGDKMLRDDARLSLDYGVAGKYNLYLDYNKIPHRFGNDGRFLWTRTGPGVYEIANPTQSAIQTAVATQFAANRAGVNFNFLNNLLQPYLAVEPEVDVGLRRDRTLARLNLGKAGRFAWAVEYAHENRNGTRPYGSSFGFNNVTELPEPIDYDTSEATLSGTFKGKSGALNLGYRYSVFENNVSTLVWDNPFRATDSTDASAYQAPSSSSIGGAARGLADLAPDNEVGSFFASGRWRLPGDWFAGGSLTYSTMTQDEPLLPYTLNTAIRGVDFDGSTFDPTDPANLPVRNADTEANVLNFNGEAGTRFGDDWSLTFRARYYDYDNQSARVEFPGYVRYHGVWEDIGRVTVPYAYTTQDLGAELGWDLAANANLAVSYTLKSWDREFREVESSDEDVLKASFDWKPNRVTTLRASVEVGDRTIDGYVVEAQEESFIHPEGVNNLPALRKFAQAAREYTAWSLLAQFLPTETLSLSLGASARADEYPESEFGLTDDEILQYSFDLSWAPSEANVLYLFGHLADREVEQAARQSGATPSTRPIDSWFAAFDETNDTFGLGWTTKLGGEWALDVSGRYAESDGTADFTAFPGGLPLASPGAGLPARTAAQDFDNYEDFELFTGKVKLDYAVNEHATCGFWYQYEDYTADSFITQGVTNYLPGALLIAADNGDYEANLFALTLKLAF
jgi:MtrB/PioB family decaheme-associated outer membrane protein